MKRRGFSLMEILIVIAVVAVIAGIGIPLARSAIGKSREGRVPQQPPLAGRRAGKLSAGTLAETPGTRRRTFVENLG